MTFALVSTAWAVVPEMLSNVMASHESVFCLEKFIYLEIMGIYLFLPKWTPKQATKVMDPWDN